MQTLKKYDDKARSLDEGLDHPIDNALEIPLDKAIGSYIEASSGQKEGIARSRGFFIAQQDLGKIKAFTEYASRLPVDLTQVQNYLGYEHSYIPALEPNAIQALHKRAKGSADFWEDIEIRMKKVASELIVFSSELNITGQSIINFIRNLSGYDDYKTLITSKKNEQLPDLKLNAKDAPKVGGLLALSSELLETVQGYKRNATDVKHRVEYFQLDLSEVKDTVSQALQAAVRHDLDKTFTEKVEELQRLNTRIEELGRTYETYARYGWVGAWWGPVGLTVTKSIYGPKASAVRDEQNSAIHQKTLLEGEVNRINKVIGALAGLQTTLQHFEMLTMDALSGAKNIEDIWLLINSYIEASMNQMNKNSTATTLLIFENRLANMIAQWIKISEEARKIITSPTDDQ
ncbi:alpha-xenorhabdolysin family binary toxin subunit A [Pseudomonas syringae]|uniref:Binary cytotoxin component n=1 Tax=Pseudomonas syringae TaxID=317 RepID=A0A085UN09_PSESX|nr:alpha-xenorhabdolysin family binary toxin subunit A [Pseudomonas syringae]KFE44572.1 hypothetical protein IV02_29500 [Pseudomonas syringae]